MMDKNTSDKILAGVGLGAAGYAGSLIFGPIIKLVLVICVVWICIVGPIECTYHSITGKHLLISETKTKEEHEAELEERHKKWDRQEKVRLTKKMRAGDLVAQTDLAENYLYNDDPSDDDKGLELLADAAGKDCAKAQDTFAGIYWKQGHKEEARTLWLRAARGREDRNYGTGSYHARGSIRYFFPDDYDSNWDKD